MSTQTNIVTLGEYALHLHNAWIQFRSTRDIVRQSTYTMLNKMPWPDEERNEPAVAIRNAMYGQALDAIRTLDELQHNALKLLAIYKDTVEAAAFYYDRAVHYHD